ncbi:MAG: PEGA domain-containing protein, partial [Tenuifilaceae bacterium]
MKKLFLLALLFIAILLSACATIFLGTKQKIRFDSEPRGARVIINGVDSGESTPCKIKIPRDQPKG